MQRVYKCRVSDLSKDKRPALKSTLAIAADKLGGVGGLAGKYTSTNKNTTDAKANSEEEKYTH